MVTTTKHSIAIVIIQMVHIIAHIGKIITVYIIPIGVILQRLIEIQRIMEVTEVMRVTGMALHGVTVILVEGTIMVGIIKKLK